MRLQRLFGVSVLALVMAGCSTPNPNPSSTAAAYSQLNCGMTREQVYALMGQPRSVDPAGDVGHCRRATWGIPHDSHGWGHWTVNFAGDTVAGISTSQATATFPF